MNFLQSLDDATDKHIDLPMSGLSRSSMKIIEFLQRLILLQPTEPSQLKPVDKHTIIKYYSYLRLTL
jgi:hypothetical protein